MTSASRSPRTASVRPVRSACRGRPRRAARSDRQRPRRGPRQRPRRRCAVGRGRRRRRRTARAISSTDRPTLSADAPRRRRPRRSRRRACGVSVGSAAPSSSRRASAAAKSSSSKTSRLETPVGSTTLTVNCTHSTAPPSGVVPDASMVAQGRRSLDLDLPGQEDQVRSELGVLADRRRPGRRDRGSASRSGGDRCRRGRACRCRGTRPSLGRSRPRTIGSRPGASDANRRAFTGEVPRVELVDRVGERVLVERDDAPPESLGVELAHAQEHVLEAAEAHGGPAQGQARTAHRQGFDPRGDRRPARRRRGSSPRWRRGRPGPRRRFAVGR